MGLWKYNGRLPEDDWRKVPGYETYHINASGRIVKHKGTDMERTVKATRTHRSGDSVRYSVRLFDREGRPRHHSVAILLLDAFGIPHEGLIPYHLNGLTEDNTLMNLGLATSEELGRKYGAEGMRAPVRKLDASGEIVAYYPSAREAAEKNRMRLAAMYRYLNYYSAEKYDPYGFRYEWDDTDKRTAALAKARARALEKRRRKK